MGGDAKVCGTRQGCFNGQAVWDKDFCGVLIEFHNIFFFSTVLRWSSSPECL
jgi:hypothetical protein